ncbi:aldehyde dehydrogenase family protein [Saccharothrix sp. Mg75]|uniref:aldehyde dehydrogenase family protein n=1 Tax=Saccharothrix sp. Mg75 TaxID=3445357 RepID=UPI003EF0844E
MSSRLGSSAHDWCADEAGKIAALLDAKDRRTGAVVFGAGFGPSGLPHVGTVAEVVRTSFVRQSFEEFSGRATRIVVVADDMDALRRIPDNLPAQGMLGKYVGLPLHRVPDPFGDASSLAENMIGRLRRMLDLVEVDCELVRSSDLYHGGAHDSTVRTFLADFEGINTLIGRSVGALRRKSYSFVMPLSPFTGRVIEHIRVVDVDAKAGTIAYEIPEDVVVQRPGVAHGLEPREYYPDEPIGERVTVSALGGGCKFQWKADWALRSLSGDIAYEMHGQDLAGSAHVLRQIFDRLHRTPPVLYEYGLFVDERGRKISKSVGNGFPLSEALDCLTPDALRLLLYRKPRRPRRIDLPSVPRINDAVRHEVRQGERGGAGARLRLRRIGVTTPPGGPGFGTLVRVLAACAPLDLDGATAFVERTFPSARRPAPELVARAWRYHLRTRPEPEPVVPDAETAAVLRRLADALAAAPHADPGRLLRDALGGHAPSYRSLYSVLLGRPRGPKLATWLTIAGAERSLALVRDVLSRGAQARERPVSSGLTPIDFVEVRERARLFAALLRERTAAIVRGLSGYQCANVALDEIERSVDLLDNLHLNRDYFRAKVGAVTTFLPLNQPLYATVCFGVVPSLMAEDTALRPPTVMHPHYRVLADVLDLTTHFPELHVSYDGKEEFVAQRAHRTDAVVFTGTPENAGKVRKSFPRRTLFILNGSGHNPLVVTETADVDLAVTCALRVVLYNQGQDCAGPNALLVHRDRLAEFRETLLARLRAVEHRIGPYADPDNLVGPNTDPDHAVKMVRRFRDDRRHWVHGGEVNPVSGLIRPAVFEKDLTLGGNFNEFFAPVFFLQPYDGDADLARYFEDRHYAANAMYISVFGDSPYVKSLLDTPLHDADSILWDTDLHLTERGHLPYGGRGPAASCLYVDGVRLPGATLPQRDIYLHLVAPRSGPC